MHLLEFVQSCLLIITDLSIGCRPQVATVAVSTSQLDDNDEVDDGNDVVSDWMDSVKESEPRHAPSHQHGEAPSVGLYPHQSVSSECKSLTFRAVLTCALCHLVRTGLKILSIVSLASCLRFLQNDSSSSVTLD